MNRTNLRKLGEYLLSDHLTMDFSMSFFCIDSESNPLVPVMPIDSPHCGTVACALGMGPSAGIEARPTETWIRYAFRAFGVSWAEFHWCFSASWSHWDNTPQGAGKRIMWLLEQGLPKDYKAQVKGLAPLCYKEVGE